MLILKYILLAFTAAFLGSVSGMGGGVILKPSMDLMGDFNVSTIGILTSGTVMFMSLTSILRQRKVIKYSPYKNMLFLYLVIGSVIGGFFGQFLLELTLSFYNDIVVKLIQNIILTVIILLIILYMKRKEKIKSLNKQSLISFVITGITLGVIASYLGIGGGPLNVALLIYVFGMRIKTAVICSLIIIFFSQLSKLITIALTTGFAAYDLSLLPYMIITGIVGGLIGTIVSKRCKDEQIEQIFNIVQIGIIIITFINIYNLSYYI